MISTVTCYVVATEPWLLETFVITQFVKAVSEMQVILWLEWKLHKFTPCYQGGETRGAKAPLSIRKGAKPP